MYSPYIGVTFSVCSFGNCYCDWPNRWHLSLCDGFLRLHRLFWRRADRMSIKDSRWTSLSLQGLSSQMSVLYLLFNSVLSDFCSAGAITVCGRLHADKTFVCDHLATRGEAKPEHSLPNPSTLWTGPSPSLDLHFLVCQTGNGWTIQRSYLPLRLEICAIWNGATSHRRLLSMWNVASGHGMRLTSLCLKVKAQSSHR